MTLQELKQNFSYLETTEDKYNYLLDLAKLLPVIPTECKKDECLVQGCSSKVYSILIKDNDKIKSYFYSDSQILNGVLYIFHITVEGKTPETILEFDFMNLLKELGLNELLTSARQNGIISLIKNIQESAKKLMESA